MKKASLFTCMIIAIIGLSVTTAQAEAIDIDGNASGYADNIDYVYGMAGITIPAGYEIDSAGIELVDFSNNYNVTSFGVWFVPGWGTLGWSTMGSAPTDTDVFWTIYNMPSGPDSYGPTFYLGSLDLDFMTSPFGIYLDPNCHYYGDLRLYYGYSSEGDVVPEPGSLLLLGTGLGVLGLAAYRRRRK